jgi:hypothetical protein
MIVFFLGNLWELSMILMLILAITVLHKILYEKDVGEIKKNRSKLVDLITEKLDMFSQNIDRVRQDMASHYKSFEEKASSIESNYRNLTERVIDIENRVHEVRKTLGAAVGLMEEKIREDE